MPPCWTSVIKNIEKPGYLKKINIKHGVGLLAYFTGKKEIVCVQTNKYEAYSGGGEFERTQIPRGKLEHREASFDGALREFIEETGISPTSCCKVYQQPIELTWIDNNTKYVYAIWFIAVSMFEDVGMNTHFSIAANRDFNRQLCGTYIVNVNRKRSKNYYEGIHDKQYTLLFMDLQTYVQLKRKENKHKPLTSHTYEQFFKKVENLVAMINTSVFKKIHIQII